jgi:hypothetical protein
MWCGSLISKEDHEAFVDVLCSAYFRADGGRGDDEGCYRTVLKVREDPRDPTLRISYRRERESSTACQLCQEVVTQAMRRTRPMVPVPRSPLEGAALCADSMVGGAPQLTCVPWPWLWDV